MKVPEFEIAWLRSRETGRRFPIAILSGDSDATTDGWLPLTSHDRPEIVIVRLESRESESEAVLRANQALGRTDLKAVQLREVETQPEARGKSFQEFRHSHKPPRLTYADIYTSGGDAEVVEVVTSQAFLSTGGVVSDLS
jgi:hypothetical protein